MKLSTTTVLTVLCSLSFIEHGVSFAPPCAKRVATLPRTVMFEKEKGDWVADVWDWFASVTAVKEKEETKEEEEDWVAEEFNQISKEDVVPEATIEALETTEPEEVTTKLNEPKDAWVSRDMNKAGKAEGETQDWVAEDMKKIGKKGTPKGTNWVAQDMKEAGEVGTAHTAHLKGKDKKTKSKTDLISEDMELVGKQTGEDIVAQDMASTGMAREEKPAGWFDKLATALDKEHEKAYDDVFEDMEKVGKKGGQSNEWVAEDMKRVGKGEAITEKIDAARKETTYELGKWIEKAFNVDEIKKDMEEAGHAESRDWVAPDLKGAGHSTQGKKYPAPKKELADWIKHSEKGRVATDMTEEGKAKPGRSSRKEDISREKLNELVAEDMEIMGKTSDVWVGHDMELAGHPESHLNKGVAVPSHTQRETEEFMKTRKVKMAPKGGKEATVTETAEYFAHMEPVETVEQVEKVEQVAQVPAAQEEVDESEHHEFMHSLFRASKKLIMPWKKWEDIE